MVEDIKEAVDSVKDEIQEEMGGEKITINSLKKDLDKREKMYFDYYNCYKALIINEVGLLKIDNLVVELVKNKKISAKHKAIKRLSYIVPARPCVY